MRWRAGEADAAGPKGVHGALHAKGVFGHDMVGTGTLAIGVRYIRTFGSGRWRPYVGGKNSIRSGPVSGRWDSVADQEDKQASGPS